MRVKGPRGQGPYIYTSFEPEKGIFTLRLRCTPLVGPEAVTCGAASRWRALRALCIPDVVYSGCVACCPVWRAARCRCAWRVPAWCSQCCAPLRNGCPAGKANGARREASPRPCRVLSPATRRHKGAPLLRSESLSSETREQPWLEQLSWHPRAWVFHGFLSQEECEHLIKQARETSSSRATVHAHAARLRAAQARPELTKSSVVDNVSGKSVDSECVHCVQPRGRMSG